MSTDTPRNYARGERHGQHKLNVDMIPEIRHACAWGVNNSELARRFDVSLDTILKVKWGITWPDAGGPISPHRHGPLRGDELPQTKLSNARVLKILRAFHEDGVTITELARREGVTGQCISSIVRRKTRRDVVWPVQEERATAPVKLTGPKEPMFAFVKGKGWVNKGRWRIEQYDVFKELAKAYPDGLSEPELRHRSNRGGARNIVVGMALRDADMRQLIKIQDGIFYLTWPCDV